MSTSTTPKRFVLSDESLNADGFQVSTPGIDLARFRANPVMLYEHDAHKVIGRWDDLRVEDGRLTAVPVFDMADELAAQLAGKVERGFLGAASMGLLVQDMDTSGKHPVARRSTLMEASLVAVPSNPGAVTMVRVLAATL